MTRGPDAPDLVVRQWWADLQRGGLTLARGGLTLARGTERVDVHSVPDGWAVDDGRGTTTVTGAELEMMLGALAVLGWRGGRGEQR